MEKSTAHVCESVLERTPTATLAVDGDGRLVVCNPAAGRLVGLNGISPKGRTVADIMDDPGPMGTLCGILEDARLLGVERTRCQAVFPGQDGDRTFGYSVSPLGDGAAVMSFSDLSNAVAVERRLAEERNFADVGRVAASMAHELKAPLATAKLYVELLEPHLGLESVALGHATVVKSQIHLAHDRLRTILASVSPSGAREKGVALTNVETTVRVVVLDTLCRFPDAKIDLKVKAGEHRVALSESALSTVIANLLTNALEATDAACEVTVSVEAPPGRLVIEVADRGPGLPAGDIFAPFFTTKQGGTGLGLWLVRKTVGSAGGDVSVAARDGGGLVFRVELPTPWRELLRERRVLVVEDDDDLRRAEAGALNECGSLVTAVRRAEDILDTPLDWDCALLDWHLPGISGVELAHRLPPETPVLLVSDDHRVVAELATMSDRRAWYLAKPVDLSVYVDTASLLIAGS